MGKALVLAVIAIATISAQAPKEPDWTALEDETMRHFQAVLRLDTRNPPGNEHLAAEYLKQVFDNEGIPARILALDPKRSNVVARLKGSGRKRALLIMGHSDVVTVDEAKWKFPPFSATRDGGWVYARGTVDDKDNLTGGLMTMLLLKRMNVPLDRDVIFLSDSMLRTSVSPNIIAGGYRSNVIPSEAKATLDVRALPDEDPVKFLEQVKKIVDDPAVEVRFTAQNVRPASAFDARLDSEPYKVLEAAAKRIYGTITLPTMQTGATDMAPLRAKGMQCFGIGAAIDMEDGPKGYGMHSDQERLLESDLHRFVRYNYEVVVDLARAK